MSISNPAWRNAPLGALCACASLLCLGVGQTARADAPPRTAHLTSPVTMPPAPTQATETNARANRARRAAHASPSPAWVNIALATDSGGYVYSLWDHTQDGAMAEWVYDSSGNAGVEGPVYGPYADGDGNTWTPYDIGVNPSNGHGKVLWDRSDGAMGIWTMDTSGNALTVGPTYGPYTDWKSIGIATASDGSSDILWKRSDGAMGIWVVDSGGNLLGVGPTYGPYANSDASEYWQPIAISINPSNYYANVVWKYTDGTTGFWQLDPNGNYVTGQANTYGPFSDSGGNWNPIGIAEANDGTSDVLWARDDGAQGIWNLNSNLDVANVSQIYGPFSDSDGNWAPEYEGIGVNPSDDTANVLWDRSDGATGLWTYDYLGNATNVGPVYGPYD